MNHDRSTLLRLGRFACCLLLLIAMPAAALTLTSSAFNNNGVIPNEYTYSAGSQCTGANWSPPLTFSDVPSGTQSFALVMRDLDASNWLHWKAWNIPGTTRDMAANAAAGATFPMAVNDFGSVGYGGPCPPTPNHRYVLTLYALNTTFDSEPNQAALAAAALGTATLLGVRSPTDNVTTPPSADYFNGVWGGNDGSYLVLMKDINSGTAVGFDVPASLSSVKVWLGSGATGSFSLAGFPNSADKFTGTIAGTALMGSKTTAGSSTPYGADLKFSYVGSAYDGIWQKSDGANSYLAYITVAISGATTAVVINVAVNPDNSVTHEVFAGVATAGAFNGVSLINPSKALKLEFAGTSLAGTTTIVAVPPTRTTFAANQIIKLAQ